MEWEKVPGFIIAKNYRVLKLAVSIIGAPICFIIAKNYRVLKPCINA
ncbi:hypothetical protein HMPREF1865_01110 [Veillonella parvula]|nr:hypothetical protein HMPREF1865_01110 [Veillonella parvula]